MILRHETQETPRSDSAQQMGRDAHAAPRQEDVPAPVIDLSDDESRVEIASCACPPRLIGRVPPAHEADPHDFAAVRALVVATKHHQCDPCFRIVQPARQPALPRDVEGDSVLSHLMGKARNRVH